VDSYGMTQTVVTLAEAISMWCGVQMEMSHPSSWAKNDRSKVLR
jgi:hypothetical protein